MKNIPISNHPIDKNIIREASFSGLYIDDDLEEYGEQIRFRIRVDHFIMVSSEEEGVDPVKTPHPLLKRKWVTLTADKTVDLGGGVNEFDYFISLMSQPIIMADLITAKILSVDTDDEFNRYNKD
jgi:hypothetical protein